MPGRLLVAGVLLSLLVLAAGVRSDRADADPQIVGYPNSIAALGDSITRAANTTSFGDHPEQSWATGTDASVNSLYSRLLAANPAIAGNRFNDAVSGARISNLPGQAQNAITQNPELVVILLGANDLCTSSEASMTSVASFQTQFETGMALLSQNLPNARIAVATIPDVFNLWSILRDDPNAQQLWSVFSICQSLLANPTSMAQADVQRRANVRQRNIDFNNVLQSVCGQYVHCKFDNFASFNMAFTPSHVSTLDYFHPSLAGQTLAASVGWSASYDFTDATAPVSSSAGSASGGMLTVTLSATDNIGVSGIEYKLGTDWVRYTSPLSLAPETVLTWRAVDVNGNTEATHACKLPAWGWPAGDGDCDGFPSAVAAMGKAPESFIGTNADSGCSATSTANDEPLPDAWPMDFDDNQLANILDVGKFSAVFNSIGPNPPYSVRFDFNGDNRVTILDVGQYSVYFSKRCVP